MARPRRSKGGNGERIAGATALLLVVVGIVIGKREGGSIVKVFEHLGDQIVTAVASVLPVPQDVKKIPADDHDVKPVTVDEVGSAKPGAVFEVLHGPQTVLPVIEDADDDRVVQRFQLHQTVADLLLQKSDDGPYPLGGPTAGEEVEVEEEEEGKEENVTQFLEEMEEEEGSQVLQEEEGIVDEEERFLEEKGRLLTYGYGDGGYGDEGYGEESTPTEEEDSSQAPEEEDEDDDQEEEDSQPAEEEDSQPAEEEDSQPPEDEDEDAEDSQPPEDEESEPPEAVEESEAPEKEDSEPPEEVDSEPPEGFHSHPTEESVPAVEESVLPEEESLPPEEEVSLPEEEMFDSEMGADSSVASVYSSASLDDELAELSTSTSTSSESPTSPTSSSTSTMSSSTSSSTSSTTSTTTSISTTSSSRSTKTTATSTSGTTTSTSGTSISSSPTTFTTASSTSLSTFTSSSSSVSTFSSTSSTSSGPSTPTTASTLSTKTTDSTTTTSVSTTSTSATTLTTGSSTSTSSSTTPLVTRSTVSSMTTASTLTSTSTTTSSSSSTSTSLSTTSTGSSTSTTLSTSSTSSSTSTTLSTTSTKSSTTLSSSSTSTSTSSSTSSTSTATWDRLTAKLFLLIDATVAEVRGAVRTTIEDYMDASAPDRIVNLIVSETTDAANVVRRLQWQEKIPQNRRLTQTQTWEVNYIIIVPSDQAPAAKDIADAMRLDAAFNSLLQAAFAALGVAGDVISSFSEPPEAGSVEALIAEVVDSSAAVLVDSLISGNATRVNLTVNGQQAVAERFQVNNNTNDTAVAIAVGGGASIEVPTSTFSALGLGADSDVLVVAVPLTADFFDTTSNGTDGGDDGGDSVQGAIAIDFFSGEGSKLNVGGLTEPIRIVIPITNQSSASLCAFYDEELGEWSTTDMERVIGEASADHVVCLTLHLSLFGSILRGILGALLCSNAALLTPAGFEALGNGDWPWQVTSLALWVVLFTLFGLLALAIRIDYKRSQTETWTDRHFLVPEGSEPPAVDGDDPGADFRTVGIFAAFVVACECIRTICASLYVVFDEIINEIGAEFFEWFGEVKAICETMCEGVIEACAAASSGQNLFVISAAALARTTLSRNAHRNAAARIGVHPDDDHEGAIDQVEEHTQRLTNKQSSGDLGSPGGDRDSNDPNVRDNNPNNPNNPANRRVRRGNTEMTELTHDPNHGVRASVLSKYANEQRLKLDEEHEKHGNCCTAFKNALYQFFTVGPVGECLLFSIWAPSSIRALWLVCDILGATAVATFFVELNGGSPSIDNPPICDDEPDIGAMIGRLIVVGLMSGIFAAIPLGILTRLHRRSFIVIDYVDSPAYKRKLRVWFVKDVLLWIIGLGYAGFCALYVMLFFANVAAEDHGAWMLSAGISFMTDIVFSPLGMVLAPAVMLSVTMTFLMLYHRKSRGEVVKMLTGMDEGAMEEAAEEEIRRPQGAEAPEDGTRFTEGDTVAV